MSQFAVWERPTVGFQRLGSADLFFALGVVALGLIVAPIAKSFHWGGGVILAVGIVGLLWWLRR
jgi:hypothetical protein